MYNKIGKREEEFELDTQQKVEQAYCNFILCIWHVRWSGESLYFGMKIN